MRNNTNHISLDGCLGRIHIHLEALPMGSDLSIQISGGASHIGAMALASPGQESRSVSIAGHRETELAKKIATLLSDALSCNVAVVAGIHYDRISRSEIETVRKLSLELATTLCTLVEAKRSANADNKDPGGI